MGEKLNKFIELYSSKASAAVAQKAEKLAVFTTTREAALKLTAPVSEKYKTLGELVNEMFPQSGGVNDNLFRNVYTALTLEAADKKAVNDLFKLKDAPIAYQRALQIQKQGGEAYFNALMQAVGSGMTQAKLTFDEVIGKNSENPVKAFGEFLEGLESEGTALPEGPGGVESSAELYAAVVENGSPLGKKEEAVATAAINEGAAKKETPTAPAMPASSAVNPEEAAGAAKTEVVATAGQVTSAPPEVPAELEKKEEKQAININLETPAASAPAPVAGAVSTTSTTNITNEGAKVSTTSTINEGAAAAPSVEKTTEVSKEQVTQTSTTVPAPTAPAAPAPSTTTQINEGAPAPKPKAGGLVGEILEMAKAKGISADKLFQKASPINVAEKKAAAEASKTLEKTEAAATLNDEETAEGEEEKTVATAESPAINEGKPATQDEIAKKAALMQVAKMYGVNTDALVKGKKTETKIVDEELEGKEQVSSAPTTMPQQMEVSKTPQVLPQEPTPAPVTPAAPAPSPTVEAKAMETPEGGQMAATSPEQAGAGGAAAGAAAPTKTSIDMGSLENRLMRIEYLLANTLEVKIVE